MKPKEYVKKYDLDKPEGKFISGHFVKDFEIDFLNLCNISLNGNSRSIETFKKIVNQMRNKWDMIVQRSIPELPEELWEDFYATIVVVEREKLFPGYQAYIDKKQRDHTRRQTEYPRNKMYEDMFSGRQQHSSEYGQRFGTPGNSGQREWAEFMEMFGRMMGGIGMNDFKASGYHPFNHFDKGSEKGSKTTTFVHGGNIENDCKLLGVIPIPTEQDLKKKFRQLALEHHPDQGGDAKKFIEIKEATERVLQYIKMRS